MDLLLIIDSMILLTLIVFCVSVYWKFFRTSKVSSDEFYRKVNMMDKFVESKKMGPMSLCPEETDPQEAIDILKDFILGKEYYVVDPINGKQANTYIVNDIMRKILF